MKWLTAAPFLLIIAACQFHQPAVTPPGMPLEQERSDTASDKALTQTTTEDQSSAVSQ